ncbi:DUF397 domain-containing protein [Streptomyces sp. 6N223]|uniref:DUF397 domain-containing protein n=1 Tax=Streptomyces sp. 6N223 TaxID=3457412 RepID=UPI003FD49FBB
MLPPLGWQRSSFSSAGNNCLELTAASSAHWQKSSHSNESNNCLELTTTPDRTIGLRESDDPAAVLVTSPARLRTLLAWARTHPLVS